jgi:hypothetical protein
MACRRSVRSTRRLLAHLGRQPTAPAHNGTYAPPCEANVLPAVPGKAVEASVEAGDAVQQHKRRCAFRAVWSPPTVTLRITYPAFHMVGGWNAHQEGPYCYDGPSWCL